MKNIQFHADLKVPDDLAKAIKTICLFLYVEDAETMSLPVSGGILTIELEKDGSDSYGTTTNN